MIDNSRACAYGYDQRVEAFGSAGMAASENPPATAACATTPTGPGTRRSRTFFLDRYEASYVRQWDGLRRVPSSPAGRRRCRAPTGAIPLVLGLAAGRSLAERRPITIE